MALSLCGVPGLINDGSAHSRTGSGTTVNQGSKQVTVASYTTPMEHYDGIYSMPYIDFQSLANQELEDESEDNNGSEKIIVSKRIANYILEGSNAHLSDRNQNLVRQNQKRYAVMAEQPHHCHPHS